MNILKRFFTWVRNAHFWGLGVACISVMTGCVAVFVAGAAAGGLIVSDQRDMTTLRDDLYIQHQLSTRFARNRAFYDSHLVASSFNRVVLLVGETPMPAVKVEAGRLAKHMEGVNLVYNEIQVRHPITLSARSQDALITSDVKTRMLAKPGLRSGSIKVVTEQGVVYLLGFVSHAQADLAVQVARRAAGVRQVVKIFQYS